MMQPAYPAARAAAIRVHPHYAQHHERPQATRNGNGSVPDVETIEAMVDVAFWASLRREEVYTPQISLAYAAPDHVGQPLTFEKPVALASHPLTRLGPAVERPGIHLCVWPEEG